MANQTWLQRNTASAFTGNETGLVFQGGVGVKFILSTLKAWILGITTTTVDVSGGTLTLNATDFGDAHFIGSGTISGDKIIIFSNDDNLIRAKFAFTGTQGDEYTLPSNVKMQGWDGNWNGTTKVWTVPADGDYLAEFDWNGTNWLLKIYGAF